MNFNALLYLKGNNFSLVNTKVLLDEFAKWINWREDGKDSFLDIGSGPGNTVKEAIYPLLPENFSRLVCSDISESMVDLQWKEFQGIDRVSCEVLDIGRKIDEETCQRLGTFDHIFSFFCLMWCDQQISMDNVYKLLKPGGDCFLVIVVDGPVADALYSVVDKPRWKEYFIGWKDFCKYPYRNMENPKGMGLEFMRNAGFVDTKAELRGKDIEFSCKEEMENFLRSIPNKFSKEVTQDEEEEIFQERLQYFNKFQLGQCDKTGKIYKPDTSLILYGKKEK